MYVRGVTLILAMRRMWYLFYFYANILLFICNGQMSHYLRSQNFIRETNPWILYNLCVIRQSSIWHSVRSLFYMQCVYITHAWTVWCPDLHWTDFQPGPVFSYSPIFNLSKCVNWQNSTCSVDNDCKIDSKLFILIWENKPLCTDIFLGFFVYQTRQFPAKQNSHARFWKSPKENKFSFLSLVKPYFVLLSQ